MINTIKHIILVIFAFLVLTGFATHNAKAGVIMQSADEVFGKAMFEPGVMDSRSHKNTYAKEKSAGTYDYNYDYTMPYGGDVIWNVDHYAQCEFLMTVFGPCVDPRVVINGHPYQVYVTLDENEYLQIDSRPNANTVVKYAANGIQQDVYDMRAKQESVFEPITAGNVRVVWPGDFGFDLTLFCERSEPRWKIQGS